MASRRAGSAAAGFARRLLVEAEWEQGSVRDLKSTRRVFSASGNVPHREYVEPGLMPSMSPWTYHHPLREPVIFPWVVQGIQQHTVMLAAAEEQRRSDRDEEDVDDDAGDLPMNVAETRRVMQQVNAVALKRRLKSDPRDSFSYRELLDFLRECGAVANDEEAMRLARILDDAGVVLIFRENVYIHPERVAKLVAHALPFAVVPPNDPRRAELLKLEETKAEIDAIAHKQVRLYLWTGLAGLTCQAALFFRLTFWELSWDVMEPIAFFVTSAGLIAGYTYFLITARDPSYRDFMQRLFLSKQMKLFKKKKFDYLRYQLLRRQCQCLDPDGKNW